MIVKNVSLQERFLFGNVTQMALKWFESWKRRRCTKQIAARVSRPFLPLGRQISVSTDGEQTCSFYERENMRRELQFASENSIFSDKTYENLALRQLPNTENSGKMVNIENVVWKTIHKIHKALKSLETIRPIGKADWSHQRWKIIPFFVERNFSKKTVRLSGNE